MKLMIASDIHGSEYWCRKLVEAFAREGADRLLLLGDLLYHGPRNELPRDYSPKAVAELLNSLAGKVFSVRGNCEAEIDQELLSFPALADYALIPVGSDRVLAAIHGHDLSPRRLPPLRPGDAVLHGHTHVPSLEDRGGVMMLDPGSVAIPKNGSPNSYMTFDGETFLWKTIEGKAFGELRLPAC